MSHVYGHPSLYHFIVTMHVTIPHTYITMCIRVVTVHAFYHPLDYCSSTETYSNIISAKCDFTKCVANC